MGISRCDIDILCLVLRLLLLHEEDLPNHYWSHKASLIRNFSGVVEEGEVLLVLGRPGAGCSTLMRALANVNEPFVKIEGDISYSTIPAHEAKK